MENENNSVSEIPNSVDIPSASDSAAENVGGSNTPQATESTQSIPAIPVTAEQLIEKRGRGRPKGSGTKKKMLPGQSITEIVSENSPGNTGSSEIGSASVDSTGLETEGAPGTPGQSETIIANAQPDYGVLAGLCVAMGTNSLAIVLGPEWKPDSDEEAAQLRDSLAVYLRAKGVNDIPPGALLSMVIIAYSAKRLQKPNTKDKIRGCFLWIKSKFGRKDRE